MYSNHFKYCYESETAQTTGRKYLHIANIRTFVVTFDIFRAMNGNTVLFWKFCNKNIIQIAFGESNTCYSNTENLKTGIRITTLLFGIEDSISIFENLKPVFESQLYCLESKTASQISLHTATMAQWISRPSSPTVYICMQTTLLWSNRILRATAASPAATRNRNRQRQQHLSSRHPVHRSPRPRELQDRLPGLVCRTRMAHPRTLRTFALCARPTTFALWSLH